MIQGNKTLSKHAQSIQDILSKQNLPFKVIEFEESTRTANDAAAAIGCEVKQIVKSLLFRTQATQKPLLILASGINRVNEKSIAQIIGEKIEKADANYTKEITGFVIGGVPPIGHKQSIDTYIDEDLLALSVLWAAAGTPNAVFCLESQNLVDLTNGKIINVK